MHPKVLKDHPHLEYLHTDKFKTEEPFSYVTSHYHDQNKGFPIYMHKHCFYEINIIVQGKGYHYLANQCFEAKPGSVYVITPEIKHGYYAETQDFKIFHIILSSFFMQRYFEELSSIPGFSMLFEIEPFLRSSSPQSLFLVLNTDQLNAIMPEFDSLVLLEQSKNPGNNIIKIGKALSIIATFSRLISANCDQFELYKNSDTALILRSLEYIQANYNNKITIENLQKITNMSRSNFLRKFKFICHCTPNEYLMNLRINKSVALLRSTNLTLSTIAQECGFFDASHFTASFLKNKSMTPSEYRNQLNL